MFLHFICKLTDTFIFHLQSTPLLFDDHLMRNAKFKFLFNYNTIPYPCEAGIKRIYTYNIPIPPNTFNADT